MRFRYELRVIGLKLRLKIGRKLLLYRLKFDFLKTIYHFFYIVLDKKVCLKNMCESDQSDELEICFENGGEWVDENSDKITRSTKLS